MTPEHKRHSENLTGYLKRVVIDTVRAVVAEGGDNVELRTAEALADLLEHPRLRAARSAASPHERAQADAMVETWAKELTAQGAPPAPPPPAPLYPYHVRGWLDAAAHGIIEAAAEALRTTGKAMGAEAPSQAEMATWLATDAAESTRAEIASRQAAVWGEEPEDVTVTGWAFGGTVGQRAGVEYHAPAAALLAQAQGRTLPNPLAALLRGWQQRPRLVTPRAASKPAVLPASLAMVQEGNRRAHLFSPAAHVGADGRGGQAALPGFERPHGTTPALPLALYDLGGGEATTRGNGAPLALRLFVEGLLAFSLEDRGGAAALEITLRELLSKLYPGPGRPPKPTEYLPRLRAAIDAVNTFRDALARPQDGAGRTVVRRPGAEPAGWP